MRRFVIDCITSRVVEAEDEEGARQIAVALAPDADYHFVVELHRRGQ